MPVHRSHCPPIGGFRRITKLFTFSAWFCNRCLNERLVYDISVTFTFVVFGNRGRSGQRSNLFSSFLFPVTRTSQKRRTSRISAIPSNVTPTLSRKPFAFSILPLFLFFFGFQACFPVATLNSVVPSRFRTEAISMPISKERDRRSGVRPTGRSTHLLLGRVSFGTYLYVHNGYPFVWNL